MIRVAAGAPVVDFPGCALGATRGIERVDLSDRAVAGEVVAVIRDGLEIEVCATDQGIGADADKLKDRRGAQAIGEAALHVLSGLHEQVGLDGACDQTFQPCPDFGSLLAIAAVNGSQQPLRFMLDTGLPVGMDSALHKRAAAAAKIAAADLVTVCAKPDAIDGQGVYLAIEQIFLGAGPCDAFSRLLRVDAVLVGLDHLPTLPRHNTSKLKIAVVADLPAADLAGGGVVLAVELLPKALQFVEGAHAAPFDFARGSRSSDARYSTQ